MCDYSLTSVKTRDAQVADKLITKDFGRGTLGFSAANDCDTAVCVKPGTEIAFDEQISFRDPNSGFFYSAFFSYTKSEHRVARFRQINKESPCMHHDAIELPDGKLILLTHLAADQRAEVLQLPAAPKTEGEAEEQQRLEVVA